MLAGGFRLQAPTVRNFMRQVPAKGEAAWEKGLFRLLGSLSLARPYAASSLQPFGCKPSRQRFLVDAVLQSHFLRNAALLHQLEQALVHGSHALFAA